MDGALVSTKLHARFVQARGVRGNSIHEVAAGLVAGNSCMPTSLERRR